jgi:hypothetical protein
VANTSDSENRTAAATESAEGQILQHIQRDQMSFRHSNATKKVVLKVFMVSVKMYYCFS